MRAAIIIDGKVDNIIEIEALDALPGVQLVEAEGASIGDLWDGERIVPAPTAPAEPATEAAIVAAYMTAVQQHMDARAVSFGYDNVISVITYAEEPAVARYQAEGQAFRAWRSACWLACEQMLAAVKAGERSAPTHAELIAELPELGIEHSGPFAPTT
ncbi:MAG: hypothetical protein ACRYGO_07240 [Janthinobacterium lividum]